MDSSSRAFTLVYAWHDDANNQTTVRQRVQLDEIKRGYGREIVFRCPVCERHCKRLALRPYGMGCAECLPGLWRSLRSRHAAQCPTQTLAGGANKTLAQPSSPALCRSDRGAAARATASPHASGVGVRSNQLLRYPDLRSA